MKIYTQFEIVGIIIKEIEVMSTKIKSLQYDDLQVKQNQFAIDKLFVLLKQIQG